MQTTLLLSCRRWELRYVAYMLNGSIPIVCILNGRSMQASTISANHCSWTELLTHH